jgi:hypothetical protein
VIATCTITGTVNFAQYQFPEDWRNGVLIFMGALNLLSGFVMIVSQFQKVPERREQHRLATISWGKFHSLLRVELAKHPKDRKPCQELMRKVQEEYDHLLETSPLIPESIVNRFNQEYKDTKIDKPEICGMIEPTKVYSVLGSPPEINEKIYEVSPPEINENVSIPVKE